MSDSERMRDIAKLLLSKTKDRQANWLPRDQDGTAFTLKLDDAALTLSYVEPGAEADYIVLELNRLNPDIRRATVASFRAYVDDPNLSNAHDEPEDIQDSLLLTDLWREVSRVALKWDKVLDDVNSALLRPGVVGSPS